ncbi:SAM-dependent methyltransferase [Leuconostoc miyukkimchii]|uniref:SAM-dependent methyltransferase n=1 Tax=Leuconostoc miyukkimchii TaxID=910540 RepID=UPI001C7D8BA0|nr:SAM-dependent methyltransferase [Leuconostoc miyukkimchii]
MIPTTQTFVHQLIEQSVHVGDTVIDGTTANGTNTRFLATRVGSTGHVLSYAATKDNANATATSLFMSGLSDRVSILGKRIDDQFNTELDRQKQARIALFDYSSDAQNNHDVPINYTKQLDIVLPRLTHGGLLIVKFDTLPSDWRNYTNNLMIGDFNQAAYTTQTVQAFVIERI